MKLPDLGQMVGPLPLGGWLAAIGGGVGLAYLTRRAGAGAGAAGKSTNGAAAGDSTGGGTGVRYVSGAIGLPEGSAPADTDGDLGRGIVTNDDWSRAAVIHLVGQSGFRAFTTQNALSRYLEGRQLTADEQAIVEAAIQAVGPPPMPPVSIPPTSPTTPVPNPTTPGPAPTSPAPTTPTPPPPPTLTKCPPFPGNLLATMNVGETLIGSLPAPTGGCWFASNYGGVFALGGAPFHGSGRNGMGIGPPTERRIVSIVPNPRGKGYTLVSNFGETYNFP